jgi:[CysO sulfur-carrier protein]-S-L-cysteine hydrolase
VRCLRRRPLSQRRDGTATLPAELLQQVIDGARAALPNESVGLLVGPEPAADAARPERYIDLENVARSPYRYEIDSGVQARLMAQLERDGEHIWGIVHSHVASPAVPSSADLRNALYPDSLYLICSLAEPTPVVRAWRIRDGEVSEVDLSVG